jgi:hypothetical protein
MTSAGELLADLAARGVELRADGEALRYRPAFLVRRAEAEAMRQHKAELLALLAAGPVLTRCPNCGRPVDGRPPLCGVRPPDGELLPATVPGV